MALKWRQEHCEKDHFRAFDNNADPWFWVFTNGITYAFRFRRKKSVIAKNDLAYLPLRRECRRRRRCWEWPSRRSSRSGWKSGKKII